MPPLREIPSLSTSLLPRLAWVALLSLAACGPVHAAPADQPAKSEEACFAEIMDQMPRKDLAWQINELAVRGDARSIRVLAEYLRVQERHFPDPLPSLAEMAALERNPPPGDHWAIHFGYFIATLKSLVLSNSGESRNVAYQARDRFVQKYACDPVGKKLCEMLGEELNSAEGDVKAGIRPRRPSSQPKEG